MLPSEETPSNIEMTTQASRRERHIGKQRPPWPATFLGVRWGEGIVNDVKRRLPYYWSDWKDAWDYRVVPSTVYMYFANLLPALAFSFDMFEKTNMSYGVNEVLFASVLGSVVFSILACQPLCIVGVTGPIAVFNYTVYDIITPRGTPYLPFMAWVYLWSMIMHFVLAIANACNGVLWVTRFSCDIFGFYVAFIYLQKGIQILTLQWDTADPNGSAHASIAIALLVLGIAYLAGWIGESRFFTHRVRIFLKDYGTPLTVVFFSGYQYIGKVREVPLLRLPTAKAFSPTVEGRDWLVQFWDIEATDIFIAIPFALLLTILFYFDHNVSSLMCQGTEFPLRKPAGFHWDIFLLGITTGLSGILGLPAPNGLIPQAPFHTTSLCVTAKTSQHGNASSNIEPSSGLACPPTSSPTQPLVITHVVEQRVSNLSQGLLTILTMTAPLLKVLNQIPQAVLAGLFFIMGVEALLANGITTKLAFLLTDHQFVDPNHPLLHKVRQSSTWAFVALELIGFGATFAITQTIAAVGFPIFIFLLVPVRFLLLPKLDWFTSSELAVLDEPTAGELALISVGGGGSLEVESGNIDSSGSSTRSGGLRELESGN